MAKAGSKLGGALTALTGMALRGSNQIVTLVTTLVAAPLLGPATFGVFVIAAAFLTLIRSLLYTGAFEYQLKAKIDEDTSTECLVINLALAIGLGGMLAVFATFADTLFHSKDVAWLLLVMAPSNLIAAVAAWQESQVLRALKLRSYYIITAVVEVIAAAVAIGLLFAGAGLIAFVAQIYVRPLLLSAAYAWLQRPTLSKSFSMPQVWKVAKWSSNRYGSSFIGSMSNSGADFFLGAFLSPTASGLYRAGSRVVTAAADILAQPTRTLAAVLLSACAARGEDPNPIWPKIFSVSACVAWTGLAVLAASADSLYLVLGPKFDEAAKIVPIICLVRAITFLDQVTGPLMVAFNHVKPIVKIQVVSATALMISLALFARFGIVAAALSTLVVSGAASLTFTFICLRLFSGGAARFFSLLPVAAAPPFAAGLVVVAARMLLSPLALAPMASTIISIMAGLVAAAAVMVSLRKPLLDALTALNRHEPEGAAEIEAAAGA